MQDVYKNIAKYNQGKKLNALIVFDDMINNKKLSLIVTELFIRQKMKHFYCFYYTIIF